MTMCKTLLLIWTEGRELGHSLGEFSYCLFCGLNLAEKVKP